MYLGYISDNEENRRMINHPVHIIDDDGNLMPSAFIPFCFLGTNMSSLGTKIDKFSQPVCTKFMPVMLEGQLCYQLDLQKQGHFMKGEENGLTFLLDYNEDKSLNEPSFNNESLKSNREALIYIDTLGPSSHDYSEATLAKLRYNIFELSCNTEIL